MKCDFVKQIFVISLLTLFIPEAYSGFFAKTFNRISRITARLFTPTTISDNPLEGEWSTCWLLRKYGYDCESHEVTTSDGYMLTMYRVLCPKANLKESTSRPVAFLMHGLLCSSSVWTLSPERSLAMTMCDNGYDVWLGNARGNEYSLKHVYLNTSSPNYWMFSWSEIAAIDLPTMLNYTLKLTGQKKVTYVGQSQGTTVLMALASTNPKLAENMISSAHLLAPVTYPNFRGLLLELAPIYGVSDPNSSFVEDDLSKNFLPLVNNFKGQSYCTDTKLPQRACKELLTLLFGDSPLSDKTGLVEFLSVYPSGSSTRQLKHFLQNHVNGKFELYDFGKSVNLAKYGSEEIPQYPIADITVPIYLYYSKSDYISAESDVKRVISLLNPNTLRKAHYLDGFYHHDYITGNNVQTLVYSKILKDIANEVRKN